MTRPEWIEVAKRLTAKWPHQPPSDASLAEWYNDLREFPGAQVMAAVEALYRGGREFCPNGAQVRRKIVELTVDAPDWGDVWAKLMGAISRFSFERQTEANAWIAAWSPLAGELATLVDWRELRFSEDAITVKEAQLRGKWEALAARRQREGSLAGLPAAGLPALERVNREPRQIGEAVRELAERVAPEGTRGE